MTTTLFPEIVRGTLRPLGDAVAVDAKKLTTGDLRVLAEANAAIIRLIADLWSQQYAGLDRGANGRVFLSIVNDFLDFLKTADLGISRVSELAAAKGQEGLEISAASTATGAEVNRLRETLTELSVWLALPPSASALTGAATAAQTPAEDYRDLDTMLGDG
jgi:hypothetical protein